MKKLKAMKTKLTIVLSLFLVIGWGQNIINVNNTAAGVATDFTTLQEAVDSAQVGDIIYLYPSSTSYGNATIAKQVSIIGPGYDVAQNPSLEISTYTGNGILGNITFNDGSQGSLITGCDFSYLECIETANILVKRNFITTKMECINSASIIFDSNYFARVSNTQACSNACVDYANLYISNSSNVIIKNNIFYAWSDYSGTNAGCDPWNFGSSNLRGFDNLIIDASSNSVIRNNYFRDKCIVNNSLIENNIFTLTEQYNTACDFPINFSNTAIKNNILVDAQSNIADPSNIQGVTEADIFKGWPTQGSESFDGRFQLKDNSPAIGAGVGGIDCGPFGGDDPYILSGIPFIPVVYDINAPSTGTATGGLDVQIKVRSNN
jgi:hypothetical protein